MLSFELIVKVVIFMSIITGIIFVINKLVIKKLGLKGFKYETYSAEQRWVEYGILAIFIIWEAVTKLEYSYFSFGIFFSILFIFRIFIEWKYAKSEKYHLILSVNLVLFLLTYLSIFIIFPNIVLD